MSSRATIARRAGITDFAATSQGIIKKRFHVQLAFSVYKHDLRHNLPRQEFSERFVQTAQFFPSRPSSRYRDMGNV